MEDSNNLILPPIMGSGGGIRRTYEDSIIRVCDSEGIVYNFYYSKSNPQFYEDILTGYLYLFNENDKGIFSIHTSAESKEYVGMTINEIRNNDRFKKLIVLGIAPLTEKYCLVELIDPKALKEHLIDEKVMRL